MPNELTEDDSHAYGVVQAFSLLLSGGALYAATLLTYRGAEVFLGLVPDPYDRVVWLGVGMGIPVALCGAASGVIGGGAAISAWAAAARKRAENPVRRRMVIRLCKRCC